MKEESNAEDLPAITNDFLFHVLEPSLPSGREVYEGNDRLKERRVQWRTWMSQPLAGVMIP